MRRTGGSMGVKTGHHIVEEAKDAGHGRVRQLFLGGESFRQRKHWLGRLLVAVAGLAMVFLLGAFLFSYSSRLYEDWRENRLLHTATALLEEGKLGTAAEMARQLLGRHPDSLPALSILAEIAERENVEEAVSWRQRLARLLPNNPESQLNLASAALRFGKLDLAREALNRVSSRDRDSAAFHVVAGWLAREIGRASCRERG